MPILTTNNVVIQLTYVTSQEKERKANSPLVLEKEEMPEALPLILSKDHLVIYLLQMLQKQRRKISRHLLL